MTLLELDEVSYAGPASLENRIDAPQRCIASTKWDEYVLNTTENLQIIVLAITVDVDV